MKLITIIRLPSQKEQKQQISENKRYFATKMDKTIALVKVDLLKRVFNLRNGSQTYDTQLALVKVGCDVEKIGKHWFRSQIPGQIYF